MGRFATGGKESKAQKRARLKDNAASHQHALVAWCALLVLLGAVVAIVGYIASTGRAASTAAAEPGAAEPAQQQA